MAEAERLVRQLMQAQNADGGWPYRAGCSWTEPTSFALLALEAHGILNDVHRRGRRWLLRNQRPDGGWPPNPSVAVSTWVTSLSALALSPNEGTVQQARRHAISWLINQIKPEPGPVERFVFRLLSANPTVQAGGSPWFPGTAAWIAPTSVSILALEQTVRFCPDPKLSFLIREGQEYIVCHRCRDGGWNHGGSRYLSESAFSYPEMTGMALLALHGVPPAELALPLKFAQACLRSPGSIEALSWLQLALARHGCGDAISDTKLPCHTTRDLSLRLLALAASSNTNRLLSTFG